MSTADYNNSNHWFATNQRKYGDAVTRSIKPQATIRRANAVLERIGVTQVAEVTHLDRIGIPNYMSVRPRDLGPGISYYNGKGTTRLDAHAGALMEAVERQAGEFCEYDIVTGSYAALRGQTACVNPREIIVPTVCEYSEDMILEWVSGYDLLTHEAKLVPLNCVVCPYQPSGGTTLFYASTNGLASGNTRTEALCHALCEIIERDALAETTARAQLKPAVAQVLSGIGYAQPDGAGSDRPRMIPLRGLPRKAALLAGKMQRSGLQIFLRDLTSTAGIATIDCTIVEAGADGIPNAHGGCGTHPDARIALTRALTEAAQSRIACIQGGREDLPDIIKPRAPYDPEEMYGGDQLIEFRISRPTVTTLSTPTSASCCSACAIGDLTKPSPSI